MASSTNNDLTFGLRGKVGRMIVFRQFFGKTIVARRPEKKERIATPAQQLNKDRFKEAVIYAKNALLDESKKAAYLAVADPGQTAFNVAFADYFKAPVLSMADIEQYTGQTGEKIRVRALDDFMVNSVSVSITKADGTLIEQGEALITSNGLDWEYTSAALNDELAGTKILFTAADLPGNSTRLEITL